MITGLLNKYIEFEYKVDTEGDFGDVTSEWVFLKRKKASVSINAVNSSYSENQGEVVNYITTFITRYDKDINYSTRILYNNNYYKIRTIQEMGRKEGLIIKTDLIEGNQYE